MIFAIVLYLAVTYQVEGCVSSCGTISFNMTELNAEGSTTENLNFQQRMSVCKFPNSHVWLLEGGAGNGSTLCPNKLRRGVRAFYVGNCSTTGSSNAVSSPPSTQAIARMEFSITVTCNSGIRVVASWRNKHRMEQSKSTQSANPGTQLPQLSQLHCSYQHAL
ncbi:hypothetical protein Aperf_G00000085202 [Anoplocephala perfoliata]